MRAVLPLVIAAMLLIGGSTGFASPDHPQANTSEPKPEIKITASVDTEAPEQRPILVIHLINQSGQRLRLPDPPLLCKPAPGALWIEARIFPADGSPTEKAPECDLEVDSKSLPDIRERARSWIVLKPGEDHVVRRPLSMGLDTSLNGIYRIQVVYEGPSATEAEQEKLESAGIKAPEGVFRSEIVRYEVLPPEERAPAEKSPDAGEKPPAGKPDKLH